MIPAHFAITLALVLLLAGEAACAAEGETMPRKDDRTPAVAWDLTVLAKAPKTYDAPGFSAEGARALFYEGLPWKGKPTRVFAWYSAPKAKPGEKLPAMVLVHGGGGTAFAEWVRLWNARGYAAISMDTCGCTAGGEHGKRPRHDLGGPPGWGGFDQIDQPVADQWMYHAVADVILAGSLVRSMDEIDPDWIGLTGISWGGIVVAVVAGVDGRFKFVAPVYGCGFLDDAESLVPKEKSLAARWLAMWDPSHYLPRAKMPMLWVSGTNDFAFPMPALQKSYRTSPGPRTLAIRPAMPHGQEDGAAPEEIRAMADNLLKGEKALARITGQGLDGDVAWATFVAARPVKDAALCYTLDKGPWQPRKWLTLPTQLDAAKGRASARLPDGATAWYLNLIHEGGLVVSTEHAER
jgi:dienelactone hydrolase